jgi:uncharacterized protein (DUF4213/DUF364 family)
MLRDLVSARGLDRVEVQVQARPLSPEQAIGSPERREFPLIEGKEAMIEATVLGARGQAFTDSPSDFTGRIREVLELPLADNRHRAVFVAALNAILRQADLVEGTIHCRDDDPETCAQKIAADARGRGARSVGLIGLNPAIAQALVKEFGAESVRISDLNRQNLGTRRFNVEIEDGRSKNHELLRSSDITLITCTTLVNGAFDEILTAARDEGRTLIVYGVTGSGACRLMNLPRLCPCARS